MTEVIQARATTRIDESQFLIAERAWPGLDTFPAPANGLITTAPGAAAVTVGASSGQVTVAVEIRPTAPATIDLDAWDEIVETDLHAGTGEVIVRALMDSPPDLPVLTRHGPGRYRLRLHATGRDRDADTVAFEPTELYLIQIWPSATPQPDATHQLTDTVGANLRRQASTAAAQKPHRQQPPKRTGHA